MSEKKERVKYPQCEKVAAVQKESQMIGEFVEFLQEKKTLNSASTIRTVVVLILLNSR